MSTKHLMQRNRDDKKTLKTRRKTGEQHKKNHFICITRVIKLSTAAQDTKTMIFLYQPSKTLFFTCIPATDIHIQWGLHVQAIQSYQVSFHDRHFAILTKNAGIGAAICCETSRVSQSSIDEVRRLKI